MSSKPSILDILGSLKIDQDSSGTSWYTYTSARFSQKFDNGLKHKASTRSRLDASTSTHGIVEVHKNTGNKPGQKQRTSIPKKKLEEGNFELPPKQKKQAEKEK